MGVCGLPVPLDDHAEKILDMAIDMLECIKNVVSPVDSHPVKVRYYCSIYALSNSFFLKAFHKNDKRNLFLGVSKYHIIKTKS